MSEPTLIVTVTTAEELAAALESGARNIRLTEVLTEPVRTGVAGVTYSGPGGVSIPKGAVTAWESTGNGCSFVGLDISGGHLGLLAEGNKVRVVGCRFHDIAWRGGRATGGGVELHGTGCEVSDCDFTDIGEPGATGYSAIRTVHPIRADFNRFTRVAGALITSPDGAPGGGAVVTDTADWEQSVLRANDADGPSRLRLLVDAGVGSALERPGPSNEALFAAVRAVLPRLRMRDMSYDGLAGAPGGVLSFGVDTPISTRYAVRLPDMKEWAASYPLGVGVQAVRDTLAVIQGSAEAIQKRLA